jgi:predicted transposase YbfD/YdcC
MFIKEIFKEVKDERKARGKSYNLAAILSLVSLGIICNHNSLAAIHRFGLRLSIEQRKALGFPENKMTCYSNLTIVLRKICPNHLEQALNKIIKIVAGKEFSDEVLHVDGKALRGSGKGEDQVKLLNVFAKNINSNLHSQKISQNSNEISAMIQMIKDYEIKGKVLTGDAIFTQKEICEDIVQAEGNFLFNVKDNQKTLREEIVQAFQRAKELKESIDFYEEEIDKNHGRIEKRSIEVIDMPWEYNNSWRHIKKLARVTRYRYDVKKKKESIEIAYLITNMNDVTAKSILELNRSHWSVENNLHWIKDVVFEEDKSLIKRDNSPHIMAKLRDFALFFLRRISDKITSTREMCNDIKNSVIRKFMSLKWDF